MVEVAFCFYVVAFKAHTYIEIPETLLCICLIENGIAGVEAVIVNYIAVIIQVGRKNRAVNKKFSVQRSAVIAEAGSAYVLQAWRSGKMFVVKSERRRFRAGAVYKQLTIGCAVITYSDFCKRMI